jgi:hypothetical protein
MIFYCDVIVVIDVIDVVVSKNKPALNAIFLSKSLNSIFRNG